MTPLKIEICLHYHSSMNDMPWCVEVDNPAPIQSETMRELCDDGLLTLKPEEARLTDYPRRYWPTAKLHAFIAMLCATPLPERQWADPRNGDVCKGPGISR